MSTCEQQHEHTATPESPTISSTSSGRTSFQSHGRTLSMVAENAPLRTNRFSLQFPIQTSRAQSPDRSLPAQDVARASFDATETTEGPTDGNYLHLIAAQERRVLELKEDLERAEADLTKLKIDWARHEANRKRDDAKRMTRLQPLHISFPVSDREDDSDGSSAWLQQEMERRKALLSASRSTHRTVFPGQRHTRTLSLLSGAGTTIRGESTNMAISRPPRKDSLKNPTRYSAEPGGSETVPTPITRSSTMAAMSELQAPLDPEGLMRAGKKVAVGLTDGLWTFWEDLRQATVGEESTTIHPPRRKSSSQTLKTAKRQGSKGSLRSRSSSTIGEDSRTYPPNKKKPSAAIPATGLADPSFWSDHGIALAQPVAQAVTRKSPGGKHSKGNSAGSNEGWDNWDDSPVQSRSSSSVTSETATLPSTVSGSPRTSIGTNRDSRDMSQKKEAIPWPALKKTGLGTLRRTASHLLTEWERSLTPSPGNEFTGDDYMGASAEASALGVVSGNTGGNKGKHD